MKQLSQQEQGEHQHQHHATVAIVTGSNSGLGLGIAERLVEIGEKRKKERKSGSGKLNGGEEDEMVVILACRNVEKAEVARDSILKKYPLGRVEILQVDLSSPASSFKAAEELKKKYQRIDLFYANAGVCPVIGRNFKAVFYDIFHEGIANFFITSGRLLVQPMNLITKDGYGEVFASNVLGHYIMIDELKDLLSHGGRIIWSGSHSSKKEYFDINDIQHLKGPHPYQSSKFGVDLLSLGLNQKFQQEKRECYSFNTAPGLVISTLSYMIIPAFLWLFVIPMMILLRGFFPTFCLDPYNGAEANIMVGMHENPKDLDPSKQYLSLTKFEGSELNFTGKGGKRYVEARELGLVTQKEAAIFLNKLDELKIAAEKFKVIKKC